MRRLQKAKKCLGKNFDALLVSSTPNIIYLTGFNGFSETEREAYLLLTKTQNYIFTDGRYKEVASKIKNFKLVEISSAQKFQDGLKAIVTKEKIKKLAIDEDNIKISEFRIIKFVVKTVSDENLIENLRSVKDENEIKEIKKACKLGDKVFEYILSELKARVSEITIAKKIEIFILQNNAEISFRPIVAFGPNSSSPHHVCGNSKLKKNQIVLLDFGIKLNNYCSDMTRTVFFGKASPEQKRIYNTVLHSQQKTIEQLNNRTIEQIKASDVDEVARDHIKSEDYPSIPHSLGHGIGLEVHEKPSLSPKSKDVLQPGMVFSVEPGIYIPQFGGVRIEDLILLTKKGPQIITRANRKLIEL